ncbi:DUF349 domain-containing protein [Granulosicoccus antarcticus]|uniref:DUF349 domain-containing protein n=1 Tax=Granulosicoccus antarcticus TaxID=437505 RepID=UPI00146F9F11|nr:DUF349 domain-containing protein [Granulosicoccus antarcticus]
MKNFLKSATHQHKDPQVRLGFINDVNAETPEAQKTLTELAKNDVDLAVRVAAIGKLNDLDTLRELLDANGDDAGAISSAAESRLIERFSSGTVTDDAVRGLLASHGARLALPIAAHSTVSEQREMALQAIDDEATLVTVVQQSRLHDARLAAAMRLSQHDSMRAALTAVRSRDKLVAKQLQQKLDTAAAEEAALIARRHAVTTTLKQVESLNEGVWTPQDGGRLQAARERWASLDAGERSSYESAFATAMTAAEQRLADYTKAQEAPVAADEAPAAAPAATDETAHASGDTDKAADKDDVAVPAEEVVAEVVVEIPKVEDPALPPVQSVLAPATIAELPAVLESAQTMVAADEKLSASTHVKSVLAHGQSVAVLFDPPYEVNKARPGALQSRIKRVSALLDITKLLPGIDLSDHAYVSELQAHLDVLNDRMAKARQESSDRIKATHRQFAALSGIIKEGKWGPANSMMRRLQKKLGVMEAEERVSLDDKLARAEQQLAEMADWQDFAARPKLEALCESMEALITKELSPEALAKEVRELQSAWKGMGVSRASNDLWTRFKTAGDSAYEPCKEWFDSRQQERQEKLDAKALLCEGLEATQAELAAAEPDAEPDWKAIVRQVNNAKRDWSRNRVPDRKPDKALEARFSAALKPFEKSLAEQYDQNVKEKQELVEKVAALAEGEITQHTANQAKSLLSAWKLIGIMRRKEDQALWEVFNGHLGTIFKHQHQVEREKQRAGLEHVFRAKDIIKRLKQLAKGDSLDEAEVQGLTLEFQALAEFPERDKKFLLRDFRQALDACSRVQDNASRRRAQAEVEERLRLLALCEQLERAVEQPDAAGDTLVDDVTHAWDSSDARVSPEIAALLDKRRDAALAHLNNKTTPDYSTNETLRRNLLIKMEVAAGVETPAEDKARRMQYQLQNLQQGMQSSGLDDSRQVLEQLEREWLSTGPVANAIHDALQSRFLKAYRR